MSNPADKTVEKNALTEVERRIQNLLKNMVKPVDLDHGGLLILYQIRDYLRKDIFK